MNIYAIYGPYPSLEAAYGYALARGMNDIGRVLGIVNAETGDIIDYTFKGGTDLAHLVPRYESVAYDSLGDILTIGGKRYILQLEQQRAGAPTLSHVFDVVYVSETPGTVVRYTKAAYGSGYPATPTESTGTPVTEKIELLPGEHVIIKAVGFQDGCLPSETVTVEAEYHASPAEGVAGGTEPLADNGKINF